jgi:glycosyltransferase involved in cell wall biosynthesis
MSFGCFVPRSKTNKVKIMQAIRLFFNVRPINNASVMRLSVDGDQMRLLDNRIPKSLRATISAREVDLIVTNFKKRYTGVMSTIVNLLPDLRYTGLHLGVLGYPFKKEGTMMSWLSLFRHGWSRPVSGKPFRIWHCRRNHEMLVGWLLRDILQMKLRLVFTSAAQRDHTAWTKFLLSRMDIVVATSPESAHFLKVPFVVNMHGVVTDTYIPAQDRVAEWAATGVGGKYGIGVFGRVRHQKGTDRFVELMCELLPQYPDWTAVIVGEITPDQQAFADKLQKQIDNAGSPTESFFWACGPPKKFRFAAARDHRRRPPAQRRFWAGPCRSAIVRDNRSRHTRRCRITPDRRRAHRIFGRYFRYGYPAFPN